MAYLTREHPPDNATIPEKRAQEFEEKRGPESGKGIKPRTRHGLRFVIPISPKASRPPERHWHFGGHRQLR